MPVNRIQIRLAQDGGNYRKIPINLDFQTTDQAEVVERDFVQQAIEDNINVILDYEKVRCIPIDSQGDQLKDIIYKINLLNNGVFPVETTYGSAGYEYDDLRFRKNRFKRSFLRLSFYDSDIPTNQRLVSFSTLFCRLTTNDLQPFSVGGLPVTGGGLPNPVNQIPIRFVLQDPIQNPESISEGYHIYHFKDEIPLDLYVRTEFNNAKTGKSTPLITNPNPQPINQLASKLHMKYKLTRDSNGYYYEIDPTYSSNVSVDLGNDRVTINLYEIQVL